MKPRIYTIATTHLDTSWSWTLETTLKEYLPKTVWDNEKLFEKFPEYIFSFEGSYRYELLEEYYPREFETVKKYIAENHWFVAGSAYENGDVNIPSPEALMRNILYGNDYFFKKFGKRSVDVYLPDCFGFGWALPSVAAHSNLCGFTTQKLVWSSAHGVPFDLGIWKGPDGKEIFASLDGGDYNRTLKKVRRKGSIKRKLNSNIRNHELPVTCALYGIGDRGGAPRELGVSAVVNEVRENPNKKTEVICASTDEAFRFLSGMSEKQKKKLPVWQNELVMTNHAVGGYTSRAMSKRLNRRGEMLAEFAERQMTFSALFGEEYSQTVIDTCWKRIIAHQFHDDIPGTSLVSCYRRNWNDYFLSLNQLSEEIRASNAAISERFNTAFVEGTALMVSNPLQFERIETVEAELDFELNSLRVFDSENNEVPSQIIKSENGKTKIAILAKVKPFASTVFDVRTNCRGGRVENLLKVSAAGMENERYKVSINSEGDIAQIFDKQNNRELLKAPVRMAVFDYDGFVPYPAWELTYNEIMAKPREYAAGAKIEVLEQGPARVAIKITRSAGKSSFSQVVSLDAGAGFVRVYNEIEWLSLRSLLKTEFPLAVSNTEASYDLGLGFIKRKTNTKKLYEVPAQMWADISESDFGISILSDSRCGWDKPNANTLRLTGMHSPRAAYRDAQHLLEFGLNRYSFAILAHNNIAETQKGALCFNSPMSVCEITASRGSHEPNTPFAGIDNESVIVRAIKKAQNSDEIIVRFNEGTNREVLQTGFFIGGEIEEAREIFASEETVQGKEFLIENGRLVFDMKPFELRSFALKVKPLDFKIGNKKIYQPVLPFNACGITADENVRASGLAGGISLPAGLLPNEILSGGIKFSTEKNRDEKNNVLLCDGQKICVEGEELHVLAASLGGDCEAVFKIGEKETTVTVQDMFEPIGAWDILENEDDVSCAWVKTDTLAFNFTHAHNNDGDIFAKQLYFFKYSFKLNDAKTVQLPENKNILILSAVLCENTPQAKLFPLYDRLEKREFRVSLSEKEKCAARENKAGHRKGRLKFLKNYAQRRIKRELKQILNF